MPLEFRFETRCLSSLSKVFADAELRDAPFSEASALANEVFSFQVAYRSERRLEAVRARVEGDFGGRVTVRAVGLAPSNLPIQHHDHDGYILRSKAGLFPDPLYELGGEPFRVYPEQWRSLWVTVRLQEDIAPGPHDIGIVLETTDGTELGRETFRLHVIPASLPKQRLVHTQWFHVDCLSHYYNVEVWSEEHWQLIEAFVRTAVNHGINMILTPLFTPPLDTQVGGERLTVQLIDVEKSGDTYRFGFERLKRWVELCDRCGVEYFEMSHLFTQWGAKHAPKIIAAVNGESKRIFGWETDAGGAEYSGFLHQFLPQLADWIRESGLAKRVYFHISDEPSLDQLESYETASRIVGAHLSDFPVIDALSNYEFYEKGLVKVPIPANDHIEPFLAGGVSPLWTYYCCAQTQKVSNRFFSFPSARNRILGLQLYKFDIAGFLHWGYNFYNSQYSIRPLNPFAETDAGGAFASGDAFLVYPGADGPIDSIRSEVLYEALQDLRALQLLEELAGKERAIAVLEQGLERPITFSEYPREQERLLAIRERVNRAIAECVSQS
ncbi:DUF4091 domain-containing protein [Paenibacillus thermotolerans]|uniref:DUF4091 domain-containing protein n=1 Tax=Paenibacillus thermotolerans TaxID=3027807 RepID=UPI0023683498|nr:MULTISPECIES: DUF4091 domain-containing protein [unclassified Paenibacillus]